MAENNSNFDWDTAQPVNNASDFDWEQAQLNPAPQSHISGYSPEYANAEFSRMSKTLGTPGRNHSISSILVRLFKTLGTPGRTEGPDTMGAEGLKALIRGAGQGVSLNEMPRALAALGIEGKNKEQWAAEMRRSKEQNPSSYMAGNLIGNLLGAPKGIAKLLIGQKQGLSLGNFLRELAADIVIGQAQHETYPGGPSRMKTAATDLATSAGTQGLMGVSDLVKGYRDASRNISSNNLNRPTFQEGIDPQLAEAQAVLNKNTGVEIPLTASQLKEDPSFMEQGLSNTSIVNQQKAGEQVARDIEGRNWIPEINAKTELTQIPYVGRGEDIDPLVLARNVGFRARERDLKKQEYFQKTYEDISGELQKAKGDTFVPGQLNSVVDKIESKLIDAPNFGNNNIRMALDKIKEAGYVGSKTKYILQDTGEELSKKQAEQLAGQATKKYFFQGNPITADDLRELKKAEAANPGLNYSGFITEQNIPSVKVQTQEIPNKVSLLNLHEARKRLSDLAFTSGKETEDPLFYELKKAVDAEFKNGSNQLSRQNKVIGEKLLKVNREFAQEQLRKESSEIERGILKDMRADIPDKDITDANLFNVNSVMEKLETAAKKGNIGQLNQLEKIAGPELVQVIKNRRLQQVLRGDNSVGYDLTGIGTRLREIPSKEAQRAMFGEQLPLIESLARVGESIPASIRRAENTYEVHRISGGQPTAAVLSRLIGKFSNSPVMTELLTKQYKTAMTPAMAKFQANRIVNTLIKLEAQEQGVDITKNQPQSE